MTLVTAAQNEIEAQELDWTAQFLLEYGPNTRAAYSSDLKKFFSFCAGLGISHQNATRACCAAFSRHESELTGQSTQTVARRLSSVSSYFNYGLSEGYIEHNPMSAVRRPRISRASVSTGLAKDELKDLIAAAKADSVQSYALIALLAYNGLRISEALNIDVAHLGVERGVMTIKILRKGGKVSTIPLNPITGGAIATLVTSRNEGPLFRSRENRRMRREGAWRLVQKLTKGDHHPHSLRHTFVTTALEAGAPLQDVQDACDHADPRTTQRYNSSRHLLDNHPTFLLGEENA